LEQNARWNKKCWVKTITCEAVPLFQQKTGEEETLCSLAKSGKARASHSVQKSYQFTYPTLKNTGTLEQTYKI